MPRRRGALGGARQGRRERSYPCDTDATEDAASHHPVRPDGTGPRAGTGSDMNRAARVLGTLLVTGLAVAYILWKVDVGEALSTIADASLGWFFLAAAIMLVTVAPMAWR